MNAPPDALNALRRRLKELAPMTMAVSGGLDSRLLSRLAADMAMDLDVETIFFRGAHLSLGGTRRAHAWLRGLGLPFRILDMDLLADPEVASNTRQRCYLCKRRLFTAAGGRTLVDGTNASDTLTFRPGLAALREMGVRSPFAEIGLAKGGIRALAREVGLDDPDQPPRPCLLTRLPYDTPVDAALLGRLGRAEDALEGLGLRFFRIRLTDPDTALLQIHPAEREVYETRAQAVARALDQEGLAPRRVTWTEAVSGFYDTPG